MTPDLLLSLAAAAIGWTAAYALHRFMRAEERRLEQERAEVSRMWEKIMARKRRAQETEGHQ